MPKFNITIHVFIKPAVLNPAEKPTIGALHKLGFDSVTNLRMGKCFLISVRARNSENAHTIVNKACEELLVNDVVEQFEIVETFETEEEPPAPAAQ